MSKLSAEILDAVCSPDCPLAAEARHLIMVMTWGADGKTATGIKGQSTLGGMLGKSARQVRRLIDAVNATPNSPIRIEQCARFRPDGRGRTSNEYRLVLTNRTPTSSKSDESTGHLRPHEQADQPDTHVPLVETTNRTPEARLTGHESTTNRTPTSGDRSTMLSTLRSTMSLGAPKRKKPKRRWTRVPKGWEPSEAHRALAEKLGVNFEHELLQFSDHDFAKPKQDPDACFRTWLRNAKKFQGNGFAGRARPEPQRGMADHVKAGSIDDL